MARYGSTPLATDTWYYVAGIYDAEAQTLDVYLNGKLHNGFLLGSVTGTQRSSREAVRGRSKFKGFEFAAAIDDLYLFACSHEAEITADMHRSGRDLVAVQQTTEKRIASIAKGPRQLDIQCTCPRLRMQGFPALLQLWVRLSQLLVSASGQHLVTLSYLVISFAAGLLLVPATCSHFTLT